MSVKLDRTMYRKGTNGVLHVAPGRQLYVLQPNGSLDRTVDLATETLVEGFTDEALTVTAGTGPFSANADGQFDVWFPNGSYDLYAPADETSPLTRWQPVAVLTNAVTLAPTTTDRNLVLATAGTIPATFKVPSALPGLRLYSDGGAAQPTGDPATYGTFELNNYTTVPNDPPASPGYYTNKPTMLLKVNGVLKWGIGFDVSQGAAGSAGDRRDDLAIYHRNNATSSFRDSFYITDEAIPRLGIGAGKPTASSPQYAVQMQNGDSTRGCLYIQHDNGATDQPIIRTALGGTGNANWWGNGHLRVGGVGKPLAPLDVLGEALAQRLRLYRQQTAWQTDQATPMIYSEAAGGASYPFNTGGNLILAARPSAGGFDVVLGTHDGTTGMGVALAAKGGAGRNVHIPTGDVEFETAAKGPIVKSPDGTRYRIVVANGGALSTVVA